MENSRSSFKIKSLAKRTAHEHELGALLDLLHKKEKQRDNAVTLHVYRPHCYLEAAGAALRLSARWSTLRMEERRIFLTVVQREVEDESRLHRAGFPLLPVCYFLCLVCHWCKSECFHP